MQSSITCRHFQLHLTLILVLEVGGSPGDEMIIITAVLFTIQEQEVELVVARGPGNQDNSPCTKSRPYSYWNISSALQL